MKATVASATWRVLSIPACRRFERDLAEPAKAQQRRLASVLRENATSEYGRLHGFAEIGNYDDFRERVPIVSYDDLRPWIERIVRGESNVLTRQPVVRLVPTSGSAGGRKLIPYTSGFRHELNSAVGPWIFDLGRHYPEFTRGPAYWSISPIASPPENKRSQVPIGFDEDGAYLGNARRKLIEWSSAVPGEVRLIQNVEALRYVTLLCLLRQRELRLVSIWHPSFFTLLLDRLVDWWPNLLSDIASGKCREAPALPLATQRTIRAAPDLKRTRELSQIGLVNIRALWPALQIVSCWGDGQAALPLNELRIRMPGVTAQPKGLMATEAFVSIPFQGQHPVAINSHFFEFMDQRDRVRRAHELQLGEIYSVIVTTAAGLYRYRLDDLVEVDGFVGATPSLRFLGRGSRVSDLCGEKLTETFVTQVILKVCASFQLAPRFAMLAPEIVANGRGHYTLFVDEEFPPGLAPALDQALRANPHYAICRDLDQLDSLRCCQTAPGAYEEFCQITTQQGSRIGDIKPRALSNSTDWRTRLTLHEEPAISVEVVCR